MNEEQMHKEFEDLVVGMKDSQGMSYSLYSENGVYVLKNTHDLWPGFKLAHQAMKPIKIENKTLCLFTKDVIEAIQQAGYKIEE